MESDDNTTRKDILKHHGNRREQTSMLSIEQIRKIDPETAEMTDGEIEALRADMYETVGLAFEAWWHQKGGSKNPVGLFPLPEERGTL